MRWVLGVPNDKQKLFFTSTARFICYGGARGGGKSWAVRKKAILLALRYAGINIVIVRRTFPELRENHILPLQSELKDIAHYREIDKSFTFPNGSRIRMDYCANDGDLTHFQGVQFDICFLDEATNFTEYQYSVMTACIRGTNDFPKRMYLTCNPGGIGHGWVKRLFIDREYRGSEKAEDYVFIAATVYDNTVLMESDPNYVQMLENLPDGLREAWLYGDWDVLEGRYFTSFDRNIHVVEPFRIDKHWQRYIALDYGLDMLACYWIAMDYYGRAYVYKELYQSGLIVSEAAEKILSMMDADDDIVGYLAPPDLWNRNRDTGRSTAEIFASCGIPLNKVSNDRVQGLYDVQEWLKVGIDEHGNKAPGIRIFSNCKNLIRCLPLATHDAKNPNDMANEPHEITHSIDALRYFCAGRPYPSSRPIPKDYDAPSSIDEQIAELWGY